MKKLLFVLMLLALPIGLASCEGADGEEEGFDLSSDIVVYTRDTTSGTRDGFMSGIDFKDATTDDSLLAEGFVIKDNTGIMTSMTVDEYGIGYVSLSSVNDTIKAMHFEGVEPSEENVMNDSYGLKRPFNWLLRDEGDYPSDEVEELVLAFKAFLGTTDAADIINNAGAIGLNATETWDDIKEDHPITEEDNSEITVRFGGSDSIQKVAEALTSAFTAKAGNFVAEHDHTGSGDAYKRTREEEVDSSIAKDIGFASRPLKEHELEGVEEAEHGQLAWDAIVVIVHVDNPISDMTADTLKKIYDGTYATWEDVPSE
ncbi:MAG: substrate-binding domain-containing protein [Acholeplasmataceae bacterium]